MPVLRPSVTVLVTLAARAGSGGPQGPASPWGGLMGQKASPRAAAASGRELPWPQHCCWETKGSADPWLSRPHLPAANECVELLSLSFLIRTAGEDGEILPVSIVQGSRGWARAAVLWSPSDRGAEGLRRWQGTPCSGGMIVTAAGPSSSGVTCDSAKARRGQERSGSTGVQAAGKW